MDKYYKTIATIQLQHEFYADKNMAGAALKPLPATALFFKNHRMIFKRKNNAYIILQEASVEGSEATIPFETISLLFGINFNDRDYQLRSGLNFDPRREKIVVETGEEEEALVSEKNIMPCINAPAADGEQPLVITDKNRQVVFSSETDGKIQFDRLDDNIYEASGRPFLKCHHCSEFEAVLIFQLRSNSENLKKITMPAGRYRWRFKVQKKYSHPEILNLVDENEKVNFNSGDSNKEDLLVFLSSEPVILSDQVFTSLALYNNDIVVKKFLPVPELAHARFLSAEDKSLVLEAYITI